MTHETGHPDYRHISREHLEQAAQYYESRLGALEAVIKGLSERGVEPSHRSWIEAMSARNNARNSLEDAMRVLGRVQLGNNEAE